MIKSLPQRRTNIITHVSCKFTSGSLYCKMENIDKWMHHPTLKKRYSNFAKKTCIQGLGNGVLNRQINATTFKLTVWYSL